MRIIPAELEALVFAAAARTWLDHTLTGDIFALEGIDAAELLLARARRFAELGCAA